jgi:hypothetical protein
MIREMPNSKFPLAQYSVPITVMLCYVMVWYVMLCYVTLCYVMLYVQQ